MTTRTDRLTNAPAGRWLASAATMLIAIAMVTIGCTAASDQAAVPPAQVARPTQGPEPTAPPVPTSTTVPTATAVPTVTPAPTPSPTPVPPCGTIETRPTFADHCVIGVKEFTAICVTKPTTYFDWIEQAVERPIEAQTQLVATGESVRLDREFRSSGVSELAQILQPSAPDAIVFPVGYIDVNAIEPGHCPDTAGPSDDFQSLACQSLPSLASIGSGGTDATFIDEPSIIEESGCVRMVFDFHASPGTPLRVLPTQLAPDLRVASDPTRTVISLPTAFDAGPLTQLPLFTENAVMFQAVGADGQRSLQLLHPPSTVRVGVLDGPARLVIDITPSDSAEQYRPPVVGSNAILMSAIDPADTGFVIGEPVLIRGWVRPSVGAVPFVRSLALRGSAEELERSYNGPIPFLEVGGTFSAGADEPDAVAEQPQAWKEFALSVQTETWIGASHAILVGEQGPNGFLGSGQIVQITDADGETHELYDYVPTQILIDSTPTGWVEQG